MIGTSLRSRLFLSYLAIIVVCLVLVTAALIAVSRPVQERLALSRLAAEMTLTMPRVKAVLEQEGTPALAMAALARRANRRDVRVLLVDRTGRVLGDTDGEWLGAVVADVTADADSAGRTRGVAETPEGTPYLFVAAPVGSDLWVAFVAPRPTNNAGLFGDLGEGLLVAGLIALVLSVLLAILIARSVAEPTRRMAQAAEAIARGDYDVQLGIREPQELRVLAESLEGMAQQVKASQQSVRDLVANVSHDLRTPLTSVQGFAQALIDGVTRDEEEQRRAAAIILEEAGRMARLVDDLADLALIEAGQLRLEYQPVDVKALLESVLESNGQLARDKGIDLVAEVPALPYVVGDHDRLVQVFCNVVGNAIKYTAAGGRVRVTAQVSEGAPVTPDRHSAQRGPTTKLGRAEPGRHRVSVHVADNGCGIPAAEVARVFERFYRVDRARAWRRGYGLGLAIAREIVEAHGGHIGVESVEGLGSRFTIDLPVDHTVVQSENVSRETMRPASDQSM